MSGNVHVLNALMRLVPDVVRCAGATSDPYEDLVEKALMVNAQKIQIFKPHLKHHSKDYLVKLIERAHAKGLICNMFYADDPEEARSYIRLGIDTVLTNNYQQVALVVRES